MDMLAIIEVTTGIVLIYLILSLVCTSMLEAVIGKFGFKRENLEKAVVQLLDDETLAKKVYDQPEIKALCGPSAVKPSYITYRCIRAFHTECCY